MGPWKTGNQGVMVPESSIVLLGVSCDGAGSAERALCLSLTNRPIGVRRQAASRLGKGAYLHDNAQVVKHPPPQASPRGI